MTLWNPGDNNCAKNSVGRSCNTYADSFFYPREAKTKGALRVISAGHYCGDLVDPDDISLLMPGDFILRRGNGFLSTLIVQTLKESSGFSHAGIIDKDDDGNFRIIHSVSRGLSPVDGVQTEGLNRFVKKSIPYSTVVVRLRASDEAKNEMITTANRLLEEGRPFDRSFQLGGDEIYCSELLWIVLPDEIKAESMLYDESSGVIRFDSFLDTRFYDVVLDYRR